MHKGVRLPITCPVCNADKEHLLHLFFDCRFAENCWQSVDLKYDMREAYSVSDCLLHESAIAKYEDIVSICLVLWGIWFWRNKKVWQNQWMNHAIPMEITFKVYKEWKTARKSSVDTRAMSVNGASNLKRWQPLVSGELKLNVDASFFPGHESFSVGMVLRDQEGAFVGGNVLRYSGQQL
ncbi:uncharacterized protein LOC135151475 [Daucus carota subsp. sativus]|uniref:uncharacterized protein LOC135151475 n=1 Tax=Daucus carota subsp. sativus TaxID=79200 RepID=UPI0030830A00